MKDRKIINITHGVDTDGIVSAAMIIRANPDRKVSTVLADFAPGPIEIYKQIEAVGRMDPGDIIWTDMCPGQPRFADDIRRLGSVHRLEALFDHHDWSGKEAVLDEFGRHSVYDGRCSAELVAAHFGLTTGWMQELAEAAHESDYKEGRFRSIGLASLLDKTIAIVNYGTGSGIAPESLPYRLTLGNGFSMPLLRTGASLYDAAVPRAREEMLDSVSVEDVCGLQVGFVDAPMLLYMKPAARAVVDERNDLDTVVTIFPQGSHFMVDTSGRVDVPGMTKSLGGGGRDNMGGYLLTDRIDDRDGAVDYLKGVMREYVEE